MVRSRATIVGLVVGVHHLLAVYSISAERFALPLANFSSTVLFPAVLIVNAVPLALAGRLGAAVDAMFDSDTATKILFLSSLIIGSTVQWVLLGAALYLLIDRARRTK